MTVLFSELYGTYYRTVAAILAEAVDHPLGWADINAIIRKNAFGESTLNIPDALGEDHWRLLTAEGKTIIKHPPAMPLTTLQKRWINAIALDPRIRLFTDSPLCFPDVEPLFTPDDIDVFDKYADGDPYTDEKYIRIFRLLLDAVKNRFPVEISSISGYGNLVVTKTIPEYLEYSEKDDKFRVIGTGSRFGNTINLGRITACRRCSDAEKSAVRAINRPRPRSVIFELFDDRNALERVLMHFAHFEKEAEHLEGRRYRITLKYDKEDETEVLIRILSFGPMIRVVKPNAFIKLIRERLIDQKSCGL